MSKINKERMCIEYKIKDLTYYDYKSLIAVSYKDLECILGSDIAYQLYNCNVGYTVDTTLDKDKPQSLWFTSERELLRLLCKFGYVTKKEIFPKCL